jgi:hypothetical protein
VKIVLIACLAVSAMAATTAGAFAAPSAAAECVPQDMTINGKHAFRECGPATVTMLLNGKKYTFNHGTCRVLKGNIELQVGTTVAEDFKHNGGQAYIDLFGGDDFDDGNADLYALSGGKRFFTGSATVAVKGIGKNTGTFSGTSPKVSGSWNCHGVIIR